MLASHSGPGRRRPSSRDRFLRDRQCSRIAPCFTHRSPNSPPFRHPTPSASIRPALADAVGYRAGASPPWPRDIRAHIEAGFFEAPPDNAILGPVRPRGAPNGLMLRRGRMVAQWGDTRQVDMTFSVAKSYLSDPRRAGGGGRADPRPRRAGRRPVDDGGFDGAQNGGITWRHLLQQTSEWEGTLFGKSDLIDRGRNLVVEGKGRKGDARPLQPPGTLLGIQRRPGEPPVTGFAAPLRPAAAGGLRRADHAADRRLGRLGDGMAIETSWVEVGGRRVQSVSGGGHWGGGVFIHAEDQARIGQLVLQDGAWGGQRLLPEGWVAQCRSPCALNPAYGLLWWLNTGRAKWPQRQRRELHLQRRRREHHLGGPGGGDGRGAALGGCDAAGRLHGGGGGGAAGLSRKARLGRKRHFLPKPHLCSS